MLTAIDYDDEDSIPTTNLTVSPAANPPADKFAELLDRSAAFRTAFMTIGRRTRGPGSEGRLVSETISAGWTDQEICDLIVAYRRKTGGMRGLTATTMTAVLQQARQGLAESTEEDSMAAVLGRLVPGQPLSDEQRRRFLAWLGRLLGTQVNRIVRCQSDPPIYVIETAAGAVRVESGNTLLDFRRIRGAFLDATRRVLPNVKAAKWERTVQVLLLLAEDQLLGDEATELGRLRLWLDEYLELYVPLDAPPQNPREERLPYRSDGSVYIFLGAMRQWLLLSKQERITDRALALTLREAGAALEQLQFADPTSGSGRNTRSVWRLPQELLA